MIRKQAMILGCAIFLIVGTGKAETPFDALGFTYEKLIDGGSDILRQASFSPDGNLVLYSRQNGTVWQIELYDRAEDSTEILATSDTNNGTWAGNAFFNSAGDKAGYIWNDADGVNDLKVYDIPTGNTDTWTPSAPTHTSSTYYFCNPTFLGISNTEFVAWDWIDADGAADLFLYDTVSETRTNITNSSLYSEYEPFSNDAGDEIVYWSGETSTESTDTTHLLSLETGNWVKDSGFSPITGTYWAKWSADETMIGVTERSSSPHVRDLLIYDVAGNFLFDLTGPGYEGENSGSGGNGYNFMGDNFAVDGEYLFTSNADNTLGGRDVWIAVPEPATMGLLAIGGLALIRRRRAA